MNHPSMSRRRIGVRYPTWSVYLPQVMCGVADHMRDDGGWELATENNSFGEMEAVELNSTWQGDGLILFRATEQELSVFRDRNMPVVLTSTEGPDLGYPRVVPDNGMIGRMAARHLVECAVPDFAFLARGETTYKEEVHAPGFRRYSRERLAGFKGELARYSAEPTVHYLKGWPLWEDHAWKAIEQEVMDFLSTLPKPCGLFVVDDALGAVALRAAGKLGLSVPGDLAVIGHGNDLSYCYATHPALTSIPYPGREIGRCASLLLAEMIAGRLPATARIEVPVEAVIERDSTDTLAIPDPEIRELIRHIRLVVPHDALRVSELAERSSLSVTTIKTRFLQYLGHGPKQEIQRVRLKHLHHLLAGTQLSLGEIATRMKFNSAGDMSRFFVSETGRRPSDYRESLELKSTTSVPTATRQK